MKLGIEVLVFILQVYSISCCTCALGIMCRRFVIFVLSIISQILWIWVLFILHIKRFVMLSYHFAKSSFTVLVFVLQVYRNSCCAVCTRISEIQKFASIMKLNEKIILWSQWLLEINNKFNRRIATQHVCKHVYIQSLVEKKHPTLNGKKKLLIQSIINYKRIINYLPQILLVNID